MQIGVCSSMRDRGGKVTNPRIDLLAHEREITKTPAHHF
jgi:hypothetical protein